MRSLMHDVNDLRELLAANGVTRRRRTNRRATIGPSGPIRLSSRARRAGPGAGPGAGREPTARGDVEDDGGGGARAARRRRRRRRFPPRRRGHFNPPRCAKARGRVDDDDDASAHGALPTAPPAAPPAARRRRETRRGRRGTTGPSRRRVGGVPRAPVAHRGCWRHGASTRGSAASCPTRRGARARARPSGRSRLRRPSHPPPSRRRAAAAGGGAGAAAAREAARAAAAGRRRRRRPREAAAPLERAAVARACARAHIRVQPVGFLRRRRTTTSTPRTTTPPRPRLAPNHTTIRCGRRPRRG